MDARQELEELRRIDALQKKAGITTAAPKVTEQPSLLSRSVQALTHPIEATHEAINTVAEPLLTMGTGLASQVGGTMYGIGKSAVEGKFGTPQGAQEAERTAADIAEAGTYQPRSAGGKAVMQGLGNIMDEYKIPITPGSSEIAAAGKVAPAAVRQIPGAGKVAEITTKALREKQPTTAQVISSREAAPKIGAANLAKQYGIAINPVEVNPSLSNKLRMRTVGEDAASQVLTEHNAPVFKQMFKSDLGIDPKAPLNLETIKAVRKQAGAAEDTIATLGTFKGDQASLGRLKALVPDEATIGGRKAKAEIAKLVDDATTGLTNGMDSSTVLNSIRDLRKEARGIYAMPDAGQKKLARAHASMAIANELENVIDTNLTSMGKGDLLTEYRNGRTQMAKTYTLEKILDENTGELDLAKLARMTSKDNAMTGVFADAGKIAGNFPKAAKQTIAQQALTHLTRSGPAGTIGAALGSVFPGLGTIAGGVAGALTGELLSALKKKGIVTPEYQAKAAKPQDFRPMREQLGYNQVAPVTPSPPAGASGGLVPYTSTGEVLPPGAPQGGPNWTFGKQGEAPIINPEVPLLRDIPYEEQINRMRNPQWEGRTQWQREQGQAADQAQAQAEALRHQPARNPVTLDFDPVSGKLRPVEEMGTSIPPVDTMKAAVDKISTGRSFDLTAAEKVVWDKRKVTLSQIDPQLSTLSDKQILERMNDRQWVNNAVQKIRDKEAGFAEIERRANSAQEVANARKQRELLMETADELQGKLTRQPAPNFGMGRVTREAIDVANALRRTK